MCRLPLRSLCLLFLLLPGLLPARTVRVATFNVRQGVGEVGSETYTAVQAILMRVDADIVAFQELTPGELADWFTLGAALGYVDGAVSVSTPLSGDLHVGYLSRWPILGTFNVTSPPGANDVSRPPFRAAVGVPGAVAPLVLWTVHHKALGGEENAFRRAVESVRAAWNIEDYLQANPDHREFVVLGDFNDDVGDVQTVEFFSVPPGVPASYDLGMDILFPLPYALFPRDAYETAGTGMIMLDAFQEDSSLDNTLVSGGARLDYIFVSEAIWAHPLGAPEAEVYNAVRDDGFGGLPKAGEPPAGAVSAAASDHYLVFADIRMADEDELPGAWRLHYFGHADPDPADQSLAHDDPDQDGYSNYEEYIADRNPTSAASVPDITAAHWNSAGIEIHVQTSVGRLYTLEYTGALPAPDWSELPSFTGVAGTGDSVVHTDAVGSVFRAYRLRISLAP